MSAAQSPTAQHAHAEDPVVQALFARFGQHVFVAQATHTGMPVLWLDREYLLEVLNFLRDMPEPFEMLFDLHGIDERLRSHREDLPPADFTVFYQLMSISRNRDIMLKVALSERDLEVPSVAGVYPNANWYEREVWDMFGIDFRGHPHLTRLLMPPTWNGHPLRKDYPARATEFDPYTLTVEGQSTEQEALRFDPEAWGMQRQSENTDYMFLNLGPNHPSAHGAFRIALQLDGEVVVDCVPDIGYHHRGAEKMAERQSWHSYIPYTDRIDYTGGVMNNLPYVMAVEKLAGIEVTDRAKTIRVMMAEMFRINSHLLFLGTYLQDLGAMTPVFFTFTDRQKAYEVIEGITGFRMHPAWYRIGGTAHDLPRGWDKLVQGFLDWMPKRLVEYERAMMENAIIRERTKQVAAFTTREALEWGVTGPNLRATGCDFDLRKQRPYSGYENFDFEVPLGANGDVFDRGQLRIDEMRQSLRIIQQCVDHMPAGDYKADHPLTTPPPREKMLQHIETLITHFLQVSWGPVLKPNESLSMIEATKGINSYYLTADGNTMSYRTRIRTPSFPHLQQIPAAVRGALVPDLIAHLGSIDFVMADVDR
ncbi:MULTISPECIES: NADH-quinone oxidoreductase subunit C/D [Chromohalobacter]|jgi:NADH-quinone oxidoreductase subunit C/D|uniref:NADH-quinone oxidoreductase subunit C/D n=1 Tax=Chromohalobacter israelensis (strain ATCC BAA-138 / DSM 3043 / CIP 106854 / NCIMB 13768 / 1H11) TaxID=290398 RepID=NUOCD_CHRI1|nr:MULTISPECIES: NADH-quinone oxidoreductase subunit C/D [Chromohalobacter]Q1QST4.1 RecName: Full=NADH-quinone oxidoreductase subunit C/D; AltName: Full=NADH dehydrogenase I subunit C/D; AltName: Full=NDH-1 subunit C/D [Chromohalobacter salexigens DSM 3043]ABE60474.1 NADH dehydrogenase subunit C / NADH dehydrogenase subunit D [Chromohalobacter salexigens DSM 3043]MBZ5874975.1 NADH-quinone oxidoreductase subunit C/D [Chromohalobacter salexigens]MDF9434596.1 NADH-quinone oxidoreductase subunit C/